MNAIEFVKKFGVKEAKRIVEYRDNHAKSTHVFKFNESCIDKGVINGGAYLYTKSYNDYSVSVGDLKQIVDAFELVERFGGIEHAKNERDFRREQNILQRYDAEISEAINLVEQLND